MPLFVGLSYNDANLPYVVDEKTGEYRETLCRNDLQLFIKRLKDRYDLYNTNFSWFACGEYGDTYDRPHYHILMFGFDELYDLWLRDVHAAENKLAEVWKMGFCDINVAEWSGVHYVTKYTMKIYDKEYDGITKPFTLASHGLGLPWLYTDDAVFVKSTFNIKSYYQRLNSMMLELDFSSDEALARSAGDIVKYLAPYVPKLRCTLPSGKTAPLPRYLRARLYGSFQHHQDDPFWKYKFYMRVRDQAAYSAMCREYDSENELSIEMQQRLHRARRIIDYARKKHFDKVKR